MTGDVIVKPLVTEKSNDQRKHHKYAFRVHSGATKRDVREEVARLFNVKPVKCNIITVSRKPKRLRFRSGYTASWKKAIVTLSADQTISIFEGA